MKSNTTSMSDSSNKSRSSNSNSRCNNSRSNNSRSSMCNRVANMGLMSSLHLVVMADLAGNPHLHRNTDLAGDGDTDLPGDRVALLPGNRDTDLPRDLPGILDRPLVALPLSGGMALGPSSVALDTSVATSSLPLHMAIASNNSTRNHLGVVSHDTRAVVNLLGDLVALLGHNILALLDVGRVHDGVELGVAGLLGDGVAHLVMLRVAGLVMLSVAGGLCVGVVQGLAVCIANSKLISTVSLRSHDLVSSNNITHKATRDNPNTSSSRGQAGSRQEQRKVHHRELREKIFPPV